MLIKRREPRSLAGESPDELPGVPAYSRPRRPPSPIRLVAAAVGAGFFLARRFMDASGDFASRLTRATALLERACVAISLARPVNPRIVFGDAGPLIL